MNTSALLLIAFLAISPIIKKLFDRLGLGVAEKQYGLLKRAVEDAISHVAQIASNKEMTSEEKKEKAVEISNNIASKLGVTENRRELISDLIESVLWKDDVDEGDEDDEY